MDKQLVDSWKAFTRMALSILEDGIRTGLWKVRYSGRQSFKLHDDGGIDSNVVAEPDMGGLVHEGRDELSKIPQYNTLVYSMYGAPMVARHLGKPLRTIQGGGGPYSDWDYAIFPIIRQFRRAASPFVFDEAVFEKSLSELEGFFDSDTVVLLYVAPLYNFNSEIEEELKLQDDLKIRRTTENEMEGLMSKHSFYGPFPFFKVPRLKFSIELRVDSPKVLGEETPTVTPNPIENFDKLVTALRLFKSGDVAIDIISTSPEITEVPGLQESSVHRESYLPTGHPYLLKNDEEAVFRSFWSVFKNVDLSKPASLSVSLRRFNFAYGRALPVDKLLDLVIALEALLLKKGERLNVHTLAVRVARLHGRDFQERQTIFRQIQEIYSKRSGIVHGGSPSLTESLVSGTEDRLRTCFKSILDKLRTEQHDEMLSHLDLD